MKKNSKWEKHTKKLEENENEKDNPVILQDDELDSVQGGAAPIKKPPQD